MQWISEFSAFFPPEKHMASDIHTWDTVTWTFKDLCDPWDISYTSTFFSFMQECKWEYQWVGMKFL